MTDTIEVRIEKLVYGGEGLGRVEGQAVLVPLVLPGELVAAEPLKREPRLIRARLGRLLEPSPHRIQPGCPYFGQCGGCQYQHMDYPRQLREKASILRETLLRVGKLEAPEPELLASEPWNYRNRTRFKFEKRAGEFRLGYFEMGSHRLLAIERCPIASPRINALIPQLYELGRRPDFGEGAGEIEAFANHDDSELLLAATGESAAAGWPETLVSAAREIVPGMISLGVRMARGGAAPAPTPASGSSRARRQRWTPAPLRTYGRGHILYRAAGIDFRVSHGSFFQTNRFLVEKMAAAAIEGLEGETAFDLFSGVGYFAFPLARRFARVVAVESNPLAVHDLDSNRVRAQASNIAVIEGGIEEFLAGPPAVPRAGGAAHTRGPQRPSAEMSLGSTRPDLVLLDPPRVGVGQRGAERLASLGAHTIVYVSCDPATLARDLAVLAGRGYRLESLKLVDLFPQTFHIESVAMLRMK